MGNLNFQCTAQTSDWQFMPYILKLNFSSAISSHCRSGCQHAALNFYDTVKQFEELPVREKSLYTLHRSGLNFS